MHEAELRLCTTGAPARHRLSTTSPKHAVQRRALFPKSWIGSWSFRASGLRVLKKGHEPTTAARTRHIHFPFPTPRNLRSQSRFSSRIFASPFLPLCPLCSRERRRAEAKQHAHRDSTTGRRGEERQVPLNLSRPSTGRVRPSPSWRVWTSFFSFRGTA